MKNEELMRRFKATQERTRNQYANGEDKQNQGVAYLDMACNLLLQIALRLPEPKE